MAFSGDNRGVATFSNLPNELKLLCAGMLPISDVNALACTSWEMNNVITRYMYLRAKDKRSRSGVTFFFEAVSLGSLGAARKFIELGVSVNTRELISGGSGRHIAIDRFQISSASAAHTTGHLPLHIAILGAFSDDRMARLLIHAGADIFAPCGQFVSALHMAAWHGSASIVELLLSRGADPKIIDRDGSTLLHRAVDRGFPAIVRLLLGAGVNVEGKDSLQRTALHCAAMFGDVESVEALLHWRANVKATDSFGNTPLLLAVGYRGSKAIAHRLLNLGRSYAEMLRQTQLDAVEAFSSTDGGEVQLAAGNNGNRRYSLDHQVNQNDSIIELLLGAGADIGAANEQHYSAFLWAVFRANRTK